MHGHLGAGCFDTANYAPRLLRPRGGKKLFSKIFMKKFFKKTIFSKKKVFRTKKFHFDQIVNIFEAFHMTFVKKNHQNRDRRKRMNARASFVYNL